MKMYKYILESVNNINWMAIIPLVIFFVFFVLMFIHVIRTEKSHIEKMSKLPLTNDL